VALAAVKGEKSLAELAEQFGMHATQITTWRSQLLEEAAAAAESAIDIKTLHAKIGDWRVDVGE
jgi:transposase